MPPFFFPLVVLFFASGIAGLIYEVLWLRELALLFGNAGYATATTLAAFFSGLTAGSWYWGRRVANSENPMRVYAYMELAIAVCAAGYFLILQSYALIYAFLFQHFAESRTVFTAVKFLLSLALLFPPAWLMGGTLPVIADALNFCGGKRSRFLAILYAVNTLGAVIGVILAGFYLPMLLGYRQTYWLAMALSLAVGMVAWRLSCQQGFKRTLTVDKHSSAAPGQTQLYAPAFLSGFLMLALQVLWGRMFAQVLQNSVYTFALVLTLFLLALSMGGYLANRLMVSKRNPALILYWLFVVGALLVALSPHEFMLLTDDMHYIGGQSGWFDYVWQVVWRATVIMVLPLLLLGSVFPFLFRFAEQQGSLNAGQIGVLAALNNGGSILGALLAGFILLDYLGLWASIRLVAVIYLLLAWLWREQQLPESPRLSIVPACLLLVVVSFLDISKIPLIKLAPVVEGESLLQVWEGSGATVAVVKQRQQLKLKVNNYYTLGGTGSYQLEQLQGYLPVQLHESPDSVFVLGMGTGITAGGVLLYPVRELLVTELLADVVSASEKYFGEYNNSLFFDPRVSIHQEDGRNFLRGNQQQFDVIISDLFVPWKAGVGQLYSVEHYKTVFQRLQENGLFMQWLPAYQLSAQEFSIIAHSMQQVFPQITVWRGDFGVLKPVIGLLAHRSPKPLSPQAWLFTQDRQLPEKHHLLTYYVGNLASIRRALEKYPINHDDKPVIEFQAPLTQRQTKSGQQRWLAGQPLLDLMKDLMIRDDGRYLSSLDKAYYSLPQAGYHLHHAMLLKYQGSLLGMEKAMQRYRQLLVQP